MTVKVAEWVPVPQFLRDNKALITRQLLYEVIKEGNIPTVKLGTKKMLIPANMFDILFESQTLGKDDD